MDRWIYPLVLVHGFWGLGCRDLDLASYGLRVLRF